MFVLLKNSMFIYKKKKKTEDIDLPKILLSEDPVSMSTTNLSNINILFCG